MKYNFDDFAVETRVLKLRDNTISTLAVSLQLENVRYISKC